MDHITVFGAAVQIAEGPSLFKIAEFAKAKVVPNIPWLRYLQYLFFIIWTLLNKAVSLNCCPSLSNF